MGKIELNYNNKVYTLQYNRNAIYQMEKMGFNILEMKDQPFNAIRLLIYGSLIMNHQDISLEFVDKLMSDINDLDGLVKALVEMYGNVLNTFYATKDENGITKGNATWGKLN